MNTDDIGIALKDMADRWDTPTFDAQLLADHGDRRTRRRRRQLTAAVGFICVSAIVVTGVVLSHSASHRPHQQAQPGSTTMTTPATTTLGLAPAVGPGVNVTALGATGPTHSAQTVLAHTSGLKPVTLRAQLSFRPNHRTRLDGAALVITTPGTSPGVGGPEPDSNYRGRIVAEGTPIAASAPRSRTLTVTSPKGMAPGRYPVMYVLRTELEPGQTPGLHGPFNISGQIGILIITRR